jgi:hypothetical protein
MAFYFTRASSRVTFDNVMPKWNRNEREYYSFNSSNIGRSAELGLVPNGTDGHPPEWNGTTTKAARGGLRDQDVPFLE